MLLRIFIPLLFKVFWHLSYLSSLAKLNLYKEIKVIELSVGVVENVNDLALLLFGSHEHTPVDIEKHIDLVRVIDPFSILFVPLPYNAKLIKLINFDV